MPEKRCLELLCPCRGKLAGQRNGLWCSVVESQQLDGPQGMNGGTQPQQKTYRRNIEVSVSGEMRRYNGKKAKHQKQCYAK